MNKKAIVLLLTILLIICSCPLTHQTDISGKKPLPAIFTESAIEPAPAINCSSTVRRKNPRNLFLLPKQGITTTRAGRGADYLNISLRILQCIGK